MDMGLAVLAAFLREIDGPINITTKEDRLRTQKAVYLGQLSGVDLGYRYNWYVYGPYSPRLTQDYYALTGLTATEQRQINQAVLNDESRVRLNRIRPIFNVPFNVALSKASWFELLSSYHYLRYVNGLDHVAARANLDQLKPHVSPHTDQARNVLQSVGILH